MPLNPLKGLATAGCCYVSLYSSESTSELTLRNVSSKTVCQASFFYFLFCVRIV